MLKLFFIVSALFFSAESMAEDNALSAALPSISSLSKTEECSAKQHSVLASIGLGKMACTMSKYISFDSLSKAVGTSAFQPNSRSNPLNPSDNVEEFVRYSPKFFTRINELYSKDTDNMVYGFLYKHFLTHSTRMFYMTGKELRNSSTLNAVTLPQYKLAIKNGKMINKSSFAQCKKTQATLTKTYGTNESYDETFKDCGKSGTATLFWYRRQLDGSGDALFGLLDTILRTQDLEFYKRVSVATPKTSASH